MKLKKSTRLILALGLSFTFCLIEVIGGLLSNSLAVLSDAAHMLTDFAGFGVALAATYASESPGSENYTYGLVRMEVIGALASVLLLWFITAILVFNAYIRMVSWLEGNAVPVDGLIMFLIACFGVGVNLVLGTVFMDEHGGAMTTHGECTHDHGKPHEHGGHVEMTSSDVLNSPDSPDIGHTHGSHQEVCCHGHDHDTHNDEHTRLFNTTTSHGSVDHEHGPTHELLGDFDNYTEVQPIASAVAPTDINIQAAYLHVITDTIQSLAVALAGLVIYLRPDWQFVDPLCTFIFSFFVLNTTIPLLDRVMKIFMEGVPAHVISLISLISHLLVDCLGIYFSFSLFPNPFLSLQIDWLSIKEKFSKIDGVVSVDHLHIWSLSSSSISLTCHIKATDPQAALQAALKICREENIDHPTCQVEHYLTTNRKINSLSMCV